MGYLLPDSIRRVIESNRHGPLHRGSRIRIHVHMAQLRRPAEFLFYLNRTYHLLTAELLLFT